MSGANLDAITAALDDAFQQQTIDRLPLWLGLVLIGGEGSHKTNHKK